MKPEDLYPTLDLFRILSDAERAIGILYGACAGRWPEEEAFWLSLAQDEHRHSEAVTHMASLLCQSPERFETGRLLDPVLLRAFLNYVREETRRVTSDEMTHQEVLALALENEQYLIESRYPELLQTDHSDYNKLALEVSASTVAHRQAVRERLASETI